MNRRQPLLGLLFVSPAIVSFLLFWLAPLAMTAFYSLTAWRVGSEPTYVGGANFVQLWADPLFWKATKASVLIAAYALVPSLLLALGLGLALSDPRIKLGRMWRVLFMVPVVTDWVATGLVWQLIFLPNQGVLASLGAQLNLEALIQMRWTSDATLAPIAIAIFIVWKMTSLYAMFLLAALKSIPVDVLEAARVDGAGAWRTFWAIKWPLMRPITIFVVVLSFITTLGLFEPVFMLTGGGPNNATRTLPIFLFENFFTYSRSGYASAAGIAFLVMSLAFVLVCSKVMKDEVDQ